MKSHPLRVFPGIVLALLAAAAVATAQNISAELNGKLIALRGKSALAYAPPDLPQAKYIALYFSADWCGPCHQFTPDLVRFYNELKPSHSDFEVIFMSHDHGQNAMEKYMSEMAMPWPAMRFSAARSSRLNKYAGPAIPCLVLVNDQGEVLSDSFAGKQYLGPHKVMNDLRKLLTGESTNVAQSALGTPAPIDATLNQLPKQTVNSPNGTDWDKVFKKKSP